VTITLGHLLMGFALLDLVLGLVALRRSAAQGVDDDRRRSLRFIAGAQLVSAIVLVLIALFLPVGRTRLL
jgi:hypothetical protein